MAGIGGIVASMPKGEHTGKRGPKPKPADQLKTEEFRVGCTPDEHARLIKAGGSRWAYKILMAALKAKEKASPPAPTLPPNPVETQVSIHIQPKAE